MGPDSGERKFESFDEFHGLVTTAQRSLWLHASSSEFKLQFAPTEEKSKLKFEL